MTGDVGLGFGLAEFVAEVTGENILDFSGTEA
jgi:hypothetical protein